MASSSRRFSKQSYSIDSPSFPYTSPSSSSSSSFSSSLSGCAPASKFSFPSRPSRLSPLLDSALVASSRALLPVAFAARGAVPPALAGSGARSLKSESESTAAMFERWRAVTEGTKGTNWGEAGGQKRRGVAGKLSNAGGASGRARTGSVMVGATLQKDSMTSTSPPLKLSYKDFLPARGKADVGGTGGQITTTFSSLFAEAKEWLMQRSAEVSLTSCETVTWLSHDEASLPSSSGSGSTGGGEQMLLSKRLAENAITSYVRGFRVWFIPRQQQQKQQQQQRKGSNQEELILAYEDFFPTSLTSTETVEDLVVKINKSTSITGLASGRLLMVETVSVPLATFTGKCQAKDEGRDLEVVPVDSEVTFWSECINDDAPYIFVLRVYYWRNRDVNEPPNDSNVGGGITANSGVDERWIIGIKDIAPRLTASGDYEDYEELTRRANRWIREQPEEIGTRITNIQSVLVITQQHGSTSVYDKSHVDRVECRYVIPGINNEHPADVFRILRLVYIKFSSTDVLERGGAGSTTRTEGKGQPAKGGRVIRRSSSAVDCGGGRVTQFSKGKSSVQSLAGPVSGLSFVVKYGTFGPSAKLLSSSEWFRTVVGAGGGESGRGERERKRGKKGINHMKETMTKVNAYLQQAAEGGVVDGVLCVETVMNPVELNEVKEEDASRALRRDSRETGEDGNDEETGDVGAQAAAGVSVIAETPPQSDIMFFVLSVRVFLNVRQGLTDSRNVLGGGINNRRASAAPLKGVWPSPRQLSSLNLLPAGPNSTSGPSPGGGSDHAGPIFLRNVVSRQYRYRWLAVSIFAVTCMSVIVIVSVVYSNR